MYGFMAHIYQSIVGTRSVITTATTTTTTTTTTTANKHCVEMRDLLCVLDKPVYHRRYWSFSKQNIHDTEEAYTEWKKHQT